MNAHSLAPQGINPKACIEKCQRIIGYRFSNQAYLREALTNQGFSNQRLGVIGDKVFDIHLAARWYDNKQRLAPAQWEILRKSLLSNENFAKVGVRFGIQDCTLTRCGTGRSMATTMEAIIGAVWLDSKHDFGAVNSVMDRLGFTKHALLRFPATSSTTDQPRCEFHEIQSSRSLPDRFFLGHHVGLLQLLFRHSQSFILRQRASQHSNQSRDEPARLPATEVLLIGMWSRLKHIFSAPQNMIETVPKETAAGREPSLSTTTTATTTLPKQQGTPPKQQATAHVLASGERRNAEHGDSALNTTLPIQHPVQDTEETRINGFIWSVKRDPHIAPASKRKRVAALQAHRQVLFKLPEKSRKNMPSGFSTDDVCLATNSSDEYLDKLYAFQTLELSRKRLAFFRKWNKNKGLPPEEKRLLWRLERHLVKVWRERLKLWRPRDADQGQVPIPLPNSGHTSASSSETAELSIPATAAVDSTKITADERSKDKTPRRLGPVLWTTHADQYKSVEWKQYLSKPTSDS